MEVAIEAVQAGQSRINGAAIDNEVRQQL